MKCLEGRSGGSSHSGRALSLLAQGACRQVLTASHKPARLKRPRGIVQLPYSTMKYRAVRYTIRARVERNEWIVAIYPQGVEQGGKAIHGDRERAELLARSMIDKWLGKRRVPDK